MSRRQKLPESPPPLVRVICANGHPSVRIRDVRVVDGRAVVAHRIRSRTRQAAITIDEGTTSARLQDVRASRITWLLKCPLCPRDVQLTGVNVDWLFSDIAWPGVSSIDLLELATRVGSNSF